MDTKKIIVSLSIVAAVAAVAVGATTAFFSDTETSTDNTFTAGAIDLTVDSTQHYNGKECISGLWTGGVPTAYPTGACDGTWTATNLGTQHQFFDFSDIKPGDEGENTISLHVNNNDAWLRLVIKDVTDLDVSCTEPEATATATGEDTGGVCGGTGVGSGELREKLLFSVWLDDGATDGFQCAGAAECSVDLEEGDNIKQSNEPELISAGTIDPNDTVSSGVSEIWTLPTPLLGGQTAYFGVAWNLPLATGNEVQTDSMSATMEFQVQQVRNNLNPVW